MTGLKTSHRTDITPFIAMDVVKAANALERCGRTVVHMEVGEPGTPAPRAVLERAAAMLNEGRIGYTESLGRDPLRARIAQHYAHAYGAQVEAERVIVTTGSSGGFLLAFLAAFDAGDRVALATPCYPAYPNLLAALGLEPVPVPTGPETRFALTPELVDAAAARAGPLAGLLIASPANPTGTMLSAAALDDLIGYCRGRRIRLVSDEIYHGITYDAPAVTVADLWDEAIIVNSFSKYFCMTGWRIGWLVAPPNLIRPLERLAQNLFISAPALAQEAAEAALDCGAELDAYVARYRRNRDALLRAFAGMGLDRTAPADGAFYVYADVSRFTDDSRDFCAAMLDEAGVAATPGIDFDRRRGTSFVRFSFAGSEDDISQATARLKPWLDARS